MIDCLNFILLIDAPQILYINMRLPYSELQSFVEIALTYYYICQIERLSLIQDVGVNIEEEKKDFEVRFGEEIDKVLAHQQELERRYSRLIEERRHALKLVGIFSSSWEP